MSHVFFFKSQAYCGVPVSVSSGSYSETYSYDHVSTASRLSPLLETKRLEDDTSMLVFCWVYFLLYNYNTQFGIVGWYKLVL